MCQPCTVLNGSLIWPTGKVSIWCLNSGTYRSGV
ncbi:Uncharacterised protein [Vibrio cholerae]|nr:Uncharacterised protein [Vibrio cholerae]